MSLPVRVVIESNEDGIFGDAFIDSVGAVVYWEYDESKNRVKLIEMTIDGKVTMMEEEDPFLDMVFGKVTDAVTAYLGRAEVAAENAKDEATDMAIDDMIERRNGGNQESD